MTSARAVTRWSGPAFFCSSPIANIRARRALDRAVAMAFPWADTRSEMLESVNSPTAMTVTKTISMIVITKAKPDLKLRKRPVDF